MILAFWQYDGRDKFKNRQDFSARRGQADLAATVRKQRIRYTLLCDKCLRLAALLA